VLVGFGAGAGAASLLPTVRGRLPHAGRMADWSILAGAAAVGALACAPTVVAAVATAVVIGLRTGLSGAMCQALLQTVSAPAYPGRVTAVATLVSQGSPRSACRCPPPRSVPGGQAPVSAAVCGLGGTVPLCVPALRRAQLP
jgi:hypothetical protein